MGPEPRERAAGRLALPLRELREQAKSLFQRYRTDEALSEISEKLNAFADRAGRIMGMAAETFNDGLRAIYLSFAAVLWFVSPLALVLGTGGVVWVLYQREFRSEILAVLGDGAVHWLPGLRGG